MIIVTGAAGFIGSCLTGKLNNKGIKEIVIVDDFARPEKAGNLDFKTVRERVDRNQFHQWFDENHTKVDFVLHIGARTDTTEFSTEVFDALNLNYTKEVWRRCTRYGIPMVYASSAATYGDGALGYDDDPALVPSLKPLNPYGISKNEFDKWALEQKETPPSWYGLKFFNVYGPNEYHKGRMASVVFHAFNQVTANGSVRLFRSHNPDYADGGQLRDFVYVKDVVDIIWFLINSRPASGIYNLGTGTARSFADLALAVFTALDKPVNIEFIDTPADIRDKYQYFTEARMDRLRMAGYSKPFHTLESGIEEYVQGYLTNGTYC